MLGENGAGKTTLINVLAGIDKPAAGEIEVRGKKVQVLSPYDSLQLGIGTVYQHFALIPTSTVVENLMLGFEGGVIKLGTEVEVKVTVINQEEIQRFLAMEREVWKGGVCKMNLRQGFRRRLHKEI